MACVINFIKPMYATCYEKQVQPLGYCVASISSTRCNPLGANWEHP